MPSFCFSSRTVKQSNEPQKILTKSSSNKVLISTGGTGGHIFPAIALAQQLLEDDPACQIRFIGGGLSDNKYFDKGSYTFDNVSCGSFVVKNPLSLASSLFKIARGILESCKIIRGFAPDVVVGFGSFYAFPPLVAARLMSVPLVLHEANSFPGKTISFMSRWATVTGVHFPATIGRLKGKVVEVGMPLRKGLRKGGATVQEARRYFGLDDKKLTILVFGGSQGARALNGCVVQALCNLKSVPFQVIHFAGDPAAVEKIARSYADAGVDACVKPFETRMDMAWQGADCVIGRAGASTVAELVEYEVPAVLIPYPYAAGHQDHNASFVVKEVGGGIELVEKGGAQEKLLTVESLQSNLEGMIRPDGTLASMQEAIRKYKERSRSRDLISIVKEQYEK
jgi:UDP-N-acetylglucosamine--N-acetylmuramyl-(pentapeptide) pyrophosphoryl-undecaprenol N-acetylglucosamine transferase